MAPPAGDADAVTIDLRVHADELRPAIAVQQALQVSVDAAALYLKAMEGGGLDPDHAAALIAEHPFDVLVVELGTGSFLARFSINPKTKAGRDRLLAMGGLATGALVLTGVLAPVAVPAAGGLAYLNHIFTPDAKPPNAVALQTMDPAETRGAEVEVTVTTKGNGPPGTAESFAYDISFADSPEAIAEFLAWVQRLNGLQGYGHFKSESGEPNRLRIWLTNPLDIDEARAMAESLGIEAIRIEEERRL
jgi:hypothetical protein